MPNVTKCLCEECEYNENHNCHAEGIEVMSSAVNNKVENSEGTCCNTFKPKGLQ